mmetsp:Transcript_20079/g.31408  ORF Transcript_20079/g.31408 Transcript_20079/m.31408 type:complete len:118 (+) Transcript_20079:1547-1900(+)
MVAMGEVDINGTILASQNPSLLFMLHFVFIIIFAVLLLNLLIALMGQTFESDNQDGHRTWWQLFASLVLRYESRLSEKDRLKYRCGHALPGDYAKKGDEKAACLFYDVSIFDELHDA